MKQGTVTSAGSVTYGPAYDQLERARNMITNATFNPLPSVEAQTEVVRHLEAVRDLYRKAHDEANQ